MTTDLGFEGLPQRLAAVERDRSLAAALTHLASAATGAAMQELRSEKRSTARGARARQIAIYLASIGLGWSCERASVAFGRARSTVAHACQRVEDMRASAQFDAVLDGYETLLRGIGPLLEEKPL